MAKYKHKPKKSYKYKFSIPYKLLPIILIIAVVPLIMRYHVYDTSLAQFTWSPDNNMDFDIFLYYKSLVFTFTSIAALLYLLAQKFIYNIKLSFPVIFAPIGIYAGFCVISAVVSEYAYFSVNGIYEHFETIFVLLGYAFITYYCFATVKKEEDFKLIVRFWIGSIILLSIVGFMQFIKFDIFNTPIMQFLISSEEYRDSIDYRSVFSAVYLTLYNPNYVGLYTALVIPFFTAFLLFSRTVRSGILNLFIIVSMTFCLFSSGARNGIVAVIVSFVFLVILLRKIIFRKAVYSILLIISIILIFSAVNFSNNNLLADRLKQFFNHSYEPKALQDIQTNSDNIAIVYNSNTLHISYFYSEETSFNIFFTDSDGNDLTELYDYESKQLNDPRFNSFIFDPTLYNNVVSIGIVIDGFTWHFTNQLDDGAYYYYNYAARPDKIVSAPSTSFLDGYELLGSSRGFIWSRTLPLFKNYFIIGSGPDTFAIVYPQNDYVAKYNFGYEGRIIDKPHNLYLQTAVQTGVLSLIAMLTFFIMYSVWSIKLYIKNDFSTYTSQIGVAIFTSIIGYLVSGVFNDSTICVSPVFWTLLGLGIAANSLNTNAINSN